MSFKKATKSQAKLRLAFVGPSGSGKTYSALRVARSIVGPTGKIAVIDTERGSASKYAGIFDFDVCEPESFSPESYVKLIHEAENDYDALIIDSLTHAWSGKDGALEQVDKAAARSRANGNSFAAWREVTPMHNALVDAMLACRCHLFVTMRVKSEYVIEENSQGKKVPRKIGLAPIQRDGLEYEFDVVGDMDQDNVLVVSKTRCPELKRAVVKEPGEDFAKVLKDWLTDGAPVAQPQPAEQPKASLKSLAVNGIRSWAKMPEIDTKALVLSTVQACGIKLDPGQQLTDEQWRAVLEFVTDNQTKGVDFAKATTPATQEQAA